MKMREVLEPNLGTKLGMGLQLGYYIAQRYPEYQGGRQAGREAESLGVRHGERSVSLSVV